MKGEPNMLRNRKALAALLVCCLLLGVAGMVWAEAHTHKYSDWEELKKPTCTDAGLRRRVCSCGDQQYDYPGALGHDWGPVTITNPTCTKAGEQVRVCKRDSSHVDRVEILKIDHVLTSYIKKNPTCTEPGIRAISCQNCNTMDKEEEIPATGHNWSNWSVYKNATCNEDGEERRTCQNNCGVAPETRPIAKLQHKWSAPVIIKQATCTEKGTTERRCEYSCGVEPKREDLPALGHNLTQKTVIKNATCSKPGEIKNKCSRCDYFETINPPALGKNQPNGHTSDGIWVDKRQATTKQMGLQVTHCKVCGGVAKSRNVAPRGFRYEIPTYAYGPLASEFPGGGASGVRLIFLDLTTDSDLRYALVTEDGWQVGYARVTVAGGTVRVSLEKTVESNLLRYRAWGMFPDVTAVTPVNYDTSQLFDQSVKGSGDSCVIAISMLTNYYQGGANEKFSDAMIAPGSGLSYGELNQQMLEMSEQQSGE
jgi:hypothetical protein